MEPSGAALPSNSSSRICVKNLPKYVAEDRLRDFFSQKGEVTDAKLMRTKDGKSRQFGFVGFRTEHEAEAAMKYFDKSFMDTCRITCEIARKIGDADIPRPWSRYSLKKYENLSELEKRETGPNASRAVASEAKSKKIKTIKKADDSSDPLFHEFLQVMQHRSKSKLWANDTVSAPSLEQNVDSNNKFQMAKLRGAKLHRENFELEEHKEEGTESFKYRAADKSNILVHNEALSDMDYCKSKIKKAWSDSKSSIEEGSAIGSDHNDEDDGSHVTDTLEANVTKGEAEDGNIDMADPSSSRDEKEILKSGRLYIENLPYAATAEEIEAHFTKYGRISQVHIVVDKDTKCSKGTAYVLFALTKPDDRALIEMNNSIFQGRILHVKRAEPKNLPDKQENNNSREQFLKTFKQKRNEERKSSEASGSTRAWNCLFMSQDTVAENIARKFGVSKAGFLNRESNDLAVRLALAETQVIAETKKALASSGVNIASLEELAASKTDSVEVERSKHVILVKNLPYGSSKSELVDMFGKFGSLDKVILPPTKTLALVVFLESFGARSAFSRLLYRNYKGTLLYLEWAPKNILTSTAVVDDDVVADKLGVKKALLEQQVEVNEADIDPDRIESRQVYVKNLNFITSDEAVKKHFAVHMKGGKLLSIRVMKHQKNGENVSTGFCFIEFDSFDTALSVCKDLQGTVLDGHSLIMELCDAKKDKVLPKKIDQDRSSTKLIVKNVAFEATEKDLRQLFSPFGQIKRLRIPMRFRKHRGFCFVEYATKQEAVNALQALSNTHLYGRHLVLDRAKEGESVEELRARTASHFTDSTNKLLPNKRKRMTIFG